MALCFDSSGKIYPCLSAEEGVLLLGVDPYAAPVFVPQQRQAEEVQRPAALEYTNYVLVGLNAACGVVSAIQWMNQKEPQQLAFSVTGGVVALEQLAEAIWDGFQLPVWADVVTNVLAGGSLAACTTFTVESFLKKRELPDLPPLPAGDDDDDDTTPPPPSTEIGGGQSD
ncbi:MAG: hypothetical protein Q7S00_03420 [bacterium]|nr:hypothetical protein [bacterium]